METGTLAIILRFLISGHPKRAFRQIRSWYRLRNPKEPLRLHIGCGNVRIPDFFNIDLNYSPATDYVADGEKLPCRTGTVERIETYHMIEHIPWPAVRELLTEWFRVLRDEGQLVIECPDFDQAILDYINGNEERLFSIYGRQRFPGDAHHWGYNAKRLGALLESIGFADVRREAAQDYHSKSEPCIRIEGIKRVIPK